MKIVNGEGHLPCKWLLMGEAPAMEEVRMGKPFCGKTGKELDGYLWRHHIQRSSIRIDNTVPYQIADTDKNSAAKRSTLITANTEHLRRVFDRCQPEVVFAAGALANSVFRGDVDLEMEHGISYRYNGSYGNFIVMPMYHPSAGLHQTRMMTHIEYDFAAMADAMFKGCEVQEVTAPDGKYWEVTDPNELGNYLTGLSTISCDCETVDWQPYTVQISGNNQTAVLINALNPALVEVLRVFMPHLDVVFHNVEFDLHLLLQLGVSVKSWQDTMKLAYLLGDEPQALKRLVYRHLGIRMTNYQELVAPYQYDKALAYLQQVAAREWSDPDAEMIWDVKKQKWRVKQPQNILTKVKKLLKKADSDTELHEKWKAMDGTQQVEEALGMMPEASVADVPREKLIQYGCADSDMTLRLYPILLEKWKERQNES